MKKIYILLLGYTVCLSACFAAGSPSGEFGDCGEKMSGYVAPPTTPQIATQQSAEEGFLTQALLSESVNSVDSSEVPQTILKEDENKRAKNTGVESTHVPHLEIFYTENDSERSPLSRFTRDRLTTAYDACE